MAMVAWFAGVASPATSVRGMTMRARFNARRGRAEVVLARPCLSPTGVQ
jgi:hypothetical protein